jgi:hypothetical protein
MFDQTSAVTPLPGEMRPANAPAKRKPIRSACRGLVRFGVELRKVVSFQRAVSGGYRRSIYVPESTIAADEQISPAISPQQIAAIADPMRTLGNWPVISAASRRFERLGQPAAIDFGSRCLRKNSFRANGLAIEAA